MLTSSQYAQSQGWPLFHNSRKTPDLNSLPQLPANPPWRKFPELPPEKRGVPREVPWNDSESARRGETYHIDPPEIEIINAALYLKRPLLVGGKPGTGKSSLPYAIAHELGLGAVLRWNITSRSSLKEGLYDYDALARLHDYNLKRDCNIGEYIRLGPLGTAMLSHARPRVLLIDEIDKSDIDLPNDLLNVLDEGRFIIPELFRHRHEQSSISVLPFDGETPVTINDGTVQCTQFPVVVMTSNGERDFPPPLLRRCLRLNLQLPDSARLADIVLNHLYPRWRTDESDWPTPEIKTLIDRFQTGAKTGEMATDQLLNVIHIVLDVLPKSSIAPPTLAEGSRTLRDTRENLIKGLFMPLSGINEEDGNAS